MFFNCEEFIDAFTRYFSNTQNIDQFEDICKTIAKTFDSKSCILFINEPSKRRFKVIYDYTQKPEKISNIYYDSLDNNIYISDGRRVYLYFSSFRDNVVGGIGLEKDIESLKNNVNYDSFVSILGLLGYIIYFFPKYNDAKLGLEKFRKLWNLTKSFESSQKKDELLRNFVNLSTDILGAEIGFHCEYVENEENCLYIDYSTNEDLTSQKFCNEKLLMYFKGNAKIFYRPKELDIFFATKVLSMMIIPEEKNKYFVYINKNDLEMYVPEKGFNNMDLDVAIDSAKRYLLASSRLDMQKLLEREVNELKELKTSYESLIELQKEQLKKMNAVHYISQAMRTMYSVKNVYSVLLIGLTSGRLLGYNRALLLVKDPDKEVLIGKAWIGPDDEEVEDVWKKANQRAMRFTDVIQYLREESVVLDLSNNLTKMIEGRFFPYRSHFILERAMVRKKTLLVNERVLRSMGTDISDLKNLLQVDEFAVIPLIGRESTFGVVIVDNKVTHKPITESDLEILKSLADSAGLAIESAMSYEELRNKTISLERQRSMTEYLREFSESILQNLSAAIIVLDKEGNITEWNKKSEIYFGRTKEQVIGKKIESLTQEMEDIQETAFQSMRLKEEISLSSYLINLSGYEKYFDVKISPFWDSERLMLRGVIITLEDVTDRVIMEMERKKQEKLAALGEMAARVAHELRNPITVLGGFIKRLEKNIEVPESRTKYIGIIANEIHRLEEIVNEILDFSREPRSLEFVDFNINKLITEVYLLLEEKIKEKNILFAFYTDNEDLEVKAERSRIKQVLINLIQNAVEATENGGKIDVKVEQFTDEVKVSVWNSGKPIPRDVVQKLFVPFFTTKVHGTGLGLAICKKIIEDEHKGKIWVETDDDGNKFIITLPLKRSEKDA